MPEVCNFIRGNSYLQELDVSWNKARLQSNQMLLQVLSQLKGLTSLNLSFNTFFETVTSQPQLELAEWDDDWYQKFP